MNKKIIFLPVIMIMILFRCSIPDDELVGPTWNVSIKKIPIVKADTIEVGKELEGENIKPDANGLLHGTFVDSTDFSIDDELKLDASSKSFTGIMGVFDIQTIAPVSQSVTFGEIYTNAALYQDGETMTVPAVPIPNISKSFSFSGFHTVRFNQGELIVKIKNDMEINLGTPINIEIVLFEGVIFSSTIAPGDSAEESIDLQGKTLNNNIGIIITGNTSGSSGNITIVRMSSMYIVMELKNVKAEYAVADIPFQTIDFGTQVSINRSDLKVNSATIDQGDYYLDMNFNNSFDFGLNIDLVIPKIYDIQGWQFIKNFYIPSGSSSHRFYLSEHTINLAGGELDVDVVANIPESYSVEIESTDNVSSNVDISKLNFSEVNADIIDIRENFADIEEQKLFDDPPEGLENLEFEQADFVIRCLNIPFDLTLHLDFISIKNGVSKYLSKELNVPGGSTTPNSIDITELLNDIPEKISATGWVSVSGNDITISKGTKFEIEYSLDVPLEFSFKDISTIEKSEELDLDDDAREAIEKNLISTSVEGTIINDSPISGTIDFYVGVNEFSTNNLLFSINIPKRGNEGVINVSIDKQRLDYLIEANWSRVFVTVDSVSNAELKSTDRIIIKDVSISGTGKIDIEDLRRRADNE